MPPTKAPAHPFQSREEFLRFVREVSPHADMTSILLFGAIHRLDTRLLHIAERRLTEATGLSWPKYRLLILLAHAERNGSQLGLLPSELSSQQDISRNTASALIAALESEDYISRALVESDRRKFRIRLTAKGRKVVQAQMGKHFEQVGNCFVSLLPKEREQLLALLDRVHDGLSDIT